ncbi:MAG: SDR family oxidoreductase [Pseudomonadota bacterium]
MNNSVATGLQRGLFKGRHIVITGAGRGIGAAIAQYLIDDGATVFAHLGRQQSQSHWTFPGAAGHPCLTTCSGDFQDHQVVTSVADKAAATLGHIDVLINNAGTMLGRVPSTQMEVTHYQHVTNLNAQSVVIFTTTLLPALKQAEAQASIVNVTSISADTGGSAGSSVYSAAKGFVSTYTRSLATELAADNIRVNAISPGTIDTDFHQRYSSAEKLQRTANQTPLGRLGTAADCVPACLFLAAPELSGYITGQIIGINGGIAF